MLDSRSAVIDEGSWLGEPIALVPGRLFALPLVFALDRPTSAFPGWADGFGCVNCYLLVEEDRALLVDCGFPGQFETLCTQIDSLLEPDAKLSILPLRAAELSSVGNVGALLGRYRIENIFAYITRDVIVGFDVRPRSARAHDREDPSERSFHRLVVRDPQVIDVADGAPRRVEAFRPLLRMLNQIWLYDGATRTLFTSEVFGHVWRDRSTGPWVVDESDDDPTTIDGLVALLRTGNRSWWLAGAETEPLVRSLDEVFENRVVECIAPAFGCVLQGCDVVERHAALLREALVRVGEEPAARPWLAS
jgi:hypothetical protein